MQHSCASRRTLRIFTGVGRRGREGPPETRPRGRAESGLQAKVRRRLWQLEERALNERGWLQVRRMSARRCPAVTYNSWCDHVHPTVLLQTKPPQKKRKRDHDLNELLPERPREEGDSYGSLQFNENLDEGVRVPWGVSVPSGREDVPCMVDVRGIVSWQQGTAYPPSANEAEHEWPLLVDQNQIHGDQPRPHYDGMGIRRRRANRLPAGGGPEHR